MGINTGNTNFDSQFGGFSFGRNAGNQNNDERPKAQFWLNVGYTIDVTDEGSGETTQHFVSLAGLGGQNNRSTLGGIALDSMNDFPLTGSANMQMLRKRQNELRATIMAAAEQLQPGESRIISTDPNTGLSLELRRVAVAVDAKSVDVGECPVKLTIAA